MARSIRPPAPAESSLPLPLYELRNERDRAGHVVVKLAPWSWSLSLFSLFLFPIIIY